MCLLRARIPSFAADDEGPHRPKHNLLLLLQETQTSRYELCQGHEEDVYGRAC